MQYPVHHNLAYKAELPDIRGDVLKCIERDIL